MKTYKCWSPDLETENEAREFTADNWKDAAERFAMWSYNEEEFEEIQVNVRRPDGKLFSIGVEAEMELSFHLGLGFKVDEAEEAFINGKPEGEVTP